MPTVLITDDDADHRELLAIALRKNGYDVITATDTESAMQVIEAGGLDAVLLDVRMPQESGIDLCRRLRSEQATRHLPIMLVSADVCDAGIATALLAGADDYLTKPFHRSELIARLESLLRYRKSVRSVAAIATEAALRATRSTKAQPTALAEGVAVRRSA